MERRIQTTEMKCFHLLLGISYIDHITNAEIWNKISKAIESHDLQTSVKKQKLKRYKHVIGSSGLAKTILLGTVQEKRKRRRREDNITEWC